MEHQSYYRQQAAKARHLADLLHQAEAAALLRQVAKEYDEQNKRGDARQSAD